MRYPIVIHKNSNSDYGVTFPDLLGCFSAGKSFEDAVAEAADAAESHIEALLSLGEIIPHPISIESHQANPDFSGGVWAFVEVDLSQISGNTKRVNITIPERILTIIDAFAAENQKSRSGFIADASLHYIASKIESDKKLIHG